MTYSEFKDIHAGSKIIVCGCGSSSSLLLSSHHSFITIGVNDLCRLFAPTYTVVVNDKTSFNDDRWQHIKSCESQNIFTHLKHERLPIDKSDRIVELKLGRYGGTSWADGKVDYTSNSPYIAVLIAAWMGAKEIGIMGVDWTPDHFFAKTGDHPLARRFNVIDSEYSKLEVALKSEGIRLVNLSPISRLSISRDDLSNF